MPARSLHQAAACRHAGTLLIDHFSAAYRAQASLAPIEATPA